MVGVMRRWVKRSAGSDNDWPLYTWLPALLSVSFAAPLPTSRAASHVRAVGLQLIKGEMSSRSHQDCVGAWLSMEPSAMRHVQPGQKGISSHTTARWSSSCTGVSVIRIIPPALLGMAGVYGRAFPTTTGRLQWQKRPTD